MVEEQKYKLTSFTFQMDWLNYWVRAFRGWKTLSIIE